MYKSRTDRTLLLAAVCYTYSTLYTPLRSPNKRAQTVLPSFLPLVCVGVVVVIYSSNFLVARVLMEGEVGLVAR